MQVLYRDFRLFERMPSPTLYIIRFCIPLDTAYPACLLESAFYVSAVFNATSQILVNFTRYVPLVYVVHVFLFITIAFLASTIFFQFTILLVCLECNYGVSVDESDSTSQLAGVKFKWFGPRANNIENVIIINPRTYLRQRYTSDAASGDILTETGGIAVVFTSSLGYIPQDQCKILDSRLSH